jgi:hypothetical protein
LTTPAGAATSATSGTVAGRPQPQTTAETAGGPFVRHAPDGRRAMYVDTQAYGGFMGRPMVSSPGWNKGYRLKYQVAAGVGGAPVLNVAAGGQDAPHSIMQLVQMKDAFGTQLLTGPGYDIGFLVPLYSGQFGIDLTRSPLNLNPTTVSGSAGNGPIVVATTSFTFSTYFPFEFAKGYGVISGANAALLPVLQVNIAPQATLFSTAQTTPGAQTQQVDSDFYWLPNTPVDPPGIGTTCQWIYQPSNPTIPTAASQLTQLPRLGGYLTELVLDLRDSTGARVDGWPARPKVVVDGVPLIDSDIATILDDMAIQTGIGAQAAAAQVSTGTQGTIPVPRPVGTLAFSRKTSLAQRDFGLLDTGEIFLSTNPGTQIELAGYPWGTIANTPATLNALVGQVVPSGTLVQGLPEL